jgi:hypothetical protein
MARAIDLRFLLALLSCADASTAKRCVQTLHVTLKIYATGINAAGTAPSFRDCVNAMGSELEISRDLIHLYGYDIDSKAEFTAYIRGVQCSRMPRLQAKFNSLQGDPTSLEVSLLNQMKQRGACKATAKNKSCHKITVSIDSINLSKRERIKPPPPPTPRPYWVPYTAAHAASNKAHDEAAPAVEMDKFVRFKAGFVLMSVFCLVSYYQMLTSDEADRLGRSEELANFRSSERMAISFGGEVRGGIRRPSANYGAHSAESSPATEGTGAGGFDDMWDGGGGGGSASREGRSAALAIGAS